MRIQRCSSSVKFAAIVTASLYKRRLQAETGMVCIQSLLYGAETAANLELKLCRRKNSFVMTASYDYIPTTAWWMAGIRAASWNAV